MTGIKGESNISEKKISYNDIYFFKRNKKALKIITNIPFLIG